MRALVVGGSGTIGRPVVAELLRRGHEVRVLSRRGSAHVEGAEVSLGDLESGVGLRDAVKDVDVVIDCSNVETIRGRRADHFFLNGTRRLLAAEKGADVKHHVLLSITGIDDIPYAYYKAKLHQEQAVEKGAVPWTILRSTPVDEFVGTVARRGHWGPFTFVPRMHTAPVAAVEVADALADIAEAPPLGHSPDIEGPKDEEFVDLVRILTAARGTPTTVVPFSLPGRAGRGMRDGVRAAPGGKHGTETFADWIEERYAPT